MFYNVMDKIGITGLPDTLVSRNSGTSALGPQCPDQFSISVFGHLGISTGTEIFCYQSVLIPKCPVTTTSIPLISFADGAIRIKSSAYANAAANHVPMKQAKPAFFKSVICS